jgi:hypothetical protein
MALMAERKPEETPASDDAMEFSYGAYQERQHREITRPALAMRAESLSCGGKFRFVGGAWDPIPYPGVAVVSMVDAEPENRPLVEHLAHIQEKLNGALGNPSAFCMLPVTSFHQTLANTFSDNRYRRHILENGIKYLYPQLLADAFEAMPPPVDSDPIRLRLIGISLFRTAIGLLADFPRKADFDRVMAFRNRFYAHPDLRSIGLRRTRPFIGHVTLAYIEKDLDTPEKAHLVDAVAALNAEIAEEELAFDIRRTEPRWYEDLSAFEARAEYPDFSFVCDTTRLKEGNAVCKD